MPYARGIWYEKQEDADDAEEFAAQESAALAEATDAAEQKNRAGAEAPTYYREPCLYCGESVAEGSGQVVGPLEASETPIDRRKASEVGGVGYRTHNAGFSEQCDRVRKSTLRDDVRRAYPRLAAQAVHPGEVAKTMDKLVEEWKALVDGGVTREDAEVIVVHMAGGSMHRLIRKGEPISTGVETAEYPDLEIMAPYIPGG